MKNQFLMIFVATMLSITILTGQDKPEEKERNWTVGIGMMYTFQETTYGRNFDPLSSNVYSADLNVEVGYKDVILNLYTFLMTYDENFRNIRPNNASFELAMYYSIGYQLALNKNTSTKYKPVLGVEIGPGMNAANVGVRYKRHQLLLTVLRCNRGYEFDDGFDDDDVLLLPFLHKESAKTSAMVKYQFLF